MLNEVLKTYFKAIVLCTVLLSTNALWWYHKFSLSLLTKNVRRSADNFQTVFTYLPCQVVILLWFVVPRSLCCRTRPMPTVADEGLATGTKDTTDPTMEIIIWTARDRNTPIFRQGMYHSDRITSSVNEFLARYERKEWFMRHVKSTSNGKGRSDKHSGSFKQ